MINLRFTFKDEVFKDKEYGFDAKVRSVSDSSIMSVVKKNGRGIEDFLGHFGTATFIATDTDASKQVAHGKFICNAFAGKVDFQFYLDKLNGDKNE